MPTIYDKLEAKIKYHEDRARSLQIALDDLRADDTARSKGALKENLTKAIAIRAATNGHASIGERQALIVEYLQAASAPVRVSQIVGHLATQGVVLTRDQVARQLSQIASVKRIGKFSAARYALAGTKATGKKPQLPPKIAARGAFRDAALYVLNLAKAPLPRAEFKARLTERLGRKINAEGFGSLVRYGYAKLTDEGYVGTGKAAPE